MSYENLKKAVLAVEENNRINGGEWSGWGDAVDICVAYEIDLDADDQKIVNAGIKSNGVSLAADLRKRELEEFGVNFQGEGYAHPGNAASAGMDWITNVEQHHMPV